MEAVTVKKTPEPVNVGAFRGLVRSPEGKRVIQGPSGPCPFQLTDHSPGTVLQWAEQVRDHFEDQNKHLTVFGLKTFAPLSVHKTLEALYPDEYNNELTVVRSMITKAVNRKEENTPEQKTVAPAPEVPDTSARRAKVFGHPPTAILRWMGKDAWTVPNARAVMKKLGIDVSEVTVAIQIRAGHAGDKTRGPVPVLRPEDVEALYKLEDESCKTQTDSVRTSPRAPTAERQKTSTGSKSPPASPGPSASGAGTNTTLRLGKKKKKRRSK